MMTSLTSFGYQKLGLPPDINKDKKDLKQARLAIDSIGALLDVVKDEISEQEREAFQSTLTNMRMKFVSES